MLILPNYFSLIGFAFPVILPPTDVTGEGFSPADIVRHLMINLNLGVLPSTRSSGDPTWPIFSDKEPSVPDDCITVKDTTGTSDGRRMVDGFPQAHFGLQVRVRAVDKNAGWRKAVAIRTLLSTSVRMTAVAIGSDTYNVAAVTHMGQVIPLGDETPQSKRKVFTLNMTAAITQL